VSRLDRKSEYLRRYLSCAAKLALGRQNSMGRYNENAVVSSTDRRGRTSSEIEYDMRSYDSLRPPMHGQPRSAPPRMAHSRFPLSFIAYQNVISVSMPYRQCAHVCTASRLYSRGPSSSCCCTPFAPGFGDTAVVRAD